MHGNAPSLSDGRAETPPAPFRLFGDDGTAMHQFIAELYPICRSITGDGVRQTLKLIRERIPITICEVPSGIQVFDWTVPPEWNIRDAYIKNSAGERVVDWRVCNLHIVSYSVPVHTRLSLSELKQHLHSDPERPDWIPYRTSYYNPTWGFCLKHSQLLALPEDEYEVCIDSTLQPGHLTYGELRLIGRSSDEVLISCHVCHPSLCNDNLSGIAVATAIAEHLGDLDLNYTYRFLFIPGTIGSITWLALNQAHLAKLKHGFVLTGVGDAGAPTYKLSRRGNADIDKAWAYVFKQGGGPFEMQPFSPFGYDERQYCSPGFDLPVGCFMRTPHGEYPEYHFSADNLDFVHAPALNESLSKALTAIDVLEHDGRYLNVKPFCEPKLGSYGLYKTTGGTSAGTYQMALLWLLNMSDGKTSLLDIATRSNLPWDTIKQALRALLDAGLLKQIDAPQVEPSKS